METRLDCETATSSSEEGTFFSEDQLRDMISKSQGKIRGKPDMPPDPIAIAVWSAVSKLNPNNGGVHSKNWKARHAGSRKSPWETFRQCEAELINFVAEYYAADTAQIDGYVTSGASEGNLMGLWLARNSIIAKQGTGKRIAVISCENAHFSIRKACDILAFENGEQSTSAPRNKHITIRADNEFRLSIAELRNAVLSLIDEGISAIIIVATLGTTVAGAIDDLPAISLLSREIENLHRVSIVIHVDAALGGVLFPFLPDSPFPAKWREWSHVQSLTLDLHKFGITPYGCGAFLCLGDTLKSVERSAGYTTSGLDATILGSRSGAMAAAAFAVLQSKGLNGLRHDVGRARELVADLRSRLCSNTAVSLLPDGGLNVVPIAIDDQTKEGSRIADFLEGCGIFSDILSTSNRPSASLRVFPLYVMPDVTEKSVAEFTNDLSQACL
ncbi:pyridoxal phosphate-dependent decarboxylase family protein [Agrobacterium vitis]|uniref:pyridoxal phosphate-dependent decarboxylase family protein n=1 Tax=Agrobacterium vitis TaxID=373 RepID=UPI0015D7B600|nr:pyridoxal-dependent decarboxylase [Agrobacterium vitis]